MELTEMRNIGKELKKKLNKIGIETAEDLKKLGSKDAFFRLKVTYPEVCLVHLYCLQGAIDNTEYNQLSENLKADLKKFSDSLK